MHVLFHLNVWRIHSWLLVLFVASSAILSSRLPVWSHVLRPHWLIYRTRDQNFRLHTGFSQYHQWRKFLFRSFSALQSPAWLEIPKALDQSLWVFSPFPLNCKYFCSRGKKSWFQERQPAVNEKWINFVTVSFHRMLKANYWKYSFIGLLIEWLNDRLKSPQEHVIFCDYKVEVERPFFGGSRLQKSPHF